MMRPSSIEDIEHQIDHTRKALDRTLGALRFQLSPTHQWDEIWQGAKRRSGRAARVGANWATAHQVPVFLIAGALIGITYLVAKRQRAR